MPRKEGEVGTSPECPIDMNCNDEKFDRASMTGELTLGETGPKTVVKQINEEVEEELQNLDEEIEKADNSEEKERLKYCKEKMQAEVKKAKAAKWERFTWNYEGLTSDAYFMSIVAIQHFFALMSKNCCRRCNEKATCIVQVLAYLASLAAQGIIIYYLHEENNAAIKECSVRTPNVLQWTAASAFVGEMSQEVTESIPLLLACFRETSSASESSKWAARAAFVLVWCPKFLIAVFLTFVGTRFVCLSGLSDDSDPDNNKFDNSELILNCVAMTFVVKIDEMVHRTLTKDLGELFYPSRLLVIKLQSRERADRKWNSHWWYALLKAVVWAVIVALSFVFLPCFNLYIEYIVRIRI